MFQFIEDKLNQIRANNRWRKEPVLTRLNEKHFLDQKPLHLFCDNDYLGFLRNTQLKQQLLLGIEQHGLGAGGSHLVCGHYQIHQQLIENLATYTHRESALLFSSGYMTNMSVISALLTRHHIVLADRLNHVSLNMAVKLSGARLLRYKHNDYKDLERLLQKYKSQECFIITDGVFSMDGSCADIQALNKLLKQYKNSMLYVDDAHGFGVLGEQGNLHAKQLLKDPRVLYMATFSKALGLSGGFVSGHTKLIEFLRQTAFGYIYTTAFLPAQAYGIDQALKLAKKMKTQRLALEKKIQHFRSGLKTMRFNLAQSNTPIQPVILGENQAALRLSKQLHQAGFWVQAIRPPTVPLGTARLRFTICVHHSTELINQLLNTLDDIQK